MKTKRKDQIPFDEVQEGCLFTVRQSDGKDILCIKTMYMFFADCVPLASSYNAVSVKDGSFIHIPCSLMVTCYEDAVIEY